jgi:hypothetical protein
MNTMTTPMAERPLAERIQREPLAALERRADRLAREYRRDRLIEAGGAPARVKRMHDRAAAYAAAYLMIRREQLS